MFAASRCVSFLSNTENCFQAGSLRLPGGRPNGLAGGGCFSTRRRCGFSGLAGGSAPAFWNSLSNLLSAIGDLSACVLVALPCPLGLRVVLHCVNRNTCGSGSLKGFQAGYLGHENRD